MSEGLGRDSKKSRFSSTGVRKIMGELIASDSMLKMVFGRYVNSTSVVVVVLG